MSALTSIAWKNARANRSRFTLTAIAVIMSVAFLTATLVLAASITGTADDDIAAANADLSFVVEGTVVVEGDGGPGEALERITESLPTHVLADVAAVDGVADAVGVTQGFAKLVADGEAIGTGTAIDVGRAWLGDTPLEPFRIVEGTGPASPDEIALPRALADDAGLGVGDRAQVLTPTGVHDVTVTGVALFGDADGAPLERTVLLDPASAASLMGESGFGLIRASIEPGADLDAVIAATDRVVEGVVVDGPAYIADRQNAVTSPFSFLSIFLIAFASIATIAGITIIVNTFAIAIDQRRRELALMRAVGATRSDVLRSVLGEAAVIAIVATSIGLGLGVLGAGWLRALMDTIGLTFLDGPTVITWPTLAIGAAVGLLVTIGSAWAPARRAASVAPIEALRESATETRSVSPWRTIAGIVSLAVGGAGLVAAAITANALLLAASVAIVPGLILAGPGIVAATVAVTRPVLRRVRGVEGSMAATNLTRNPRRAASTSLGLTLGVAMIGFFTIIAGSLSASISSTLSTNLTADVVVTSATTEAATIDPTLADRLSEIDGVAVAAPLSLAEGTADGESAVVGGIGSGFDEVFEFGVASGSLDELAAGGVAVWTGAEAAVPALGDIVDIVLADGTAQLPVVATFDDSLSGFDPPTHLVADATLDRIEGGLLDTNIFVELDDPIIEEAVRAVVADTPGSLFSTGASFASAATSEVDAIRNLIYALLGLTVLIAIIGVANTTALSVSERVRELGLLRAVGTTREGVRSLIRIEALLLALVGAAIGTAIGVAGSWALIETTGGADITSVTIPWISLTIIASVAVAAAVAAAAAPAWRASRIPTLDAIASA